MRAVMRVLFAAGVALSARTLPAQTLAALPAGAEVRLTTELAAGGQTHTGRLLSVARDTVYLASSDGGASALRISRPAIRTADVQSPDYVLRALVGASIGVTAAFLAAPKGSPAALAVIALPTAIGGTFALPFMRWYAVAP